MTAIKRFSPAEASKTLPLVKKIVNDILKCGRELQDLYENDAQRDAIEVKTKELEELTAEVEALGCEYKDWNFEIGLVDFPSVIDDKDVYLCWKSDEPGLMYYHGINEGFTGRKLIPKTLLEQSYA
ncbi:MAG: DUF2203 domain-containing protein [Lentisphaeraceae bacterium]|nr:DUF2203 domain-containing protein [Lentisphaeraceae bacterium]